MSSTRENKKIITPNKIGPFILRDTLGEGAFSIVKLAIHEDSKKQFACKIVPKKRLTEDEMEKRFEREVRILQQLRNPGIAAFYNIFADTLNYYIILELCKSGSLYTKILEVKKLSDDEAKVIFRQIVAAIIYLHQNGVAHRDLKPENILLDEDNHVKIIDFGFSAFKENQTFLMTTTCGSPFYASPECISGNPYDGVKSDIWSLGVVLYVMLVGDLPWTKTNQFSLFEQIKNGEFFIPNSVTTDAKDLISNLMKVKASERLDLNQVLNHPWLSNIKDVDYRVHNNYKAATNEEIDEFFRFPSVTKHPKSIPTGKMLLRFANRKPLYDHRLSINQTGIKLSFPQLHRKSLDDYTRC